MAGKAVAGNAATGEATGGEGSDGATGSLDPDSLDPDSSQTDSSHTNGSDPGEAVKIRGLSPDAVDGLLESAFTTSMLVGDDVVLDLTVDPPVIELGVHRQTLTAAPQSLPARFAVRCVDVVGASMMLAATAPLIALTWLTVRATSPGPGFYHSTRDGHGRAPFRALKFRTMVIDAEDRLQNLLDTDPAARAHYERYAKLYDDPRVTPIGRLLRRTSMDELPQLWNVLRGDMSLVGPRPWLPSEPARYGAARATVERVKPGLTGLWQVSGRSHLSFDERILLDVEYARTRTLRGDLHIMARTVGHLLQPGHNGAY